MNATDALQFIEDYSSTTIDGYKSRQSIFNNIDIRRKIFGMKTDKIKDAMKRNEKIVRFNKKYWGKCINQIFDSYNGYTLQFNLTTISNLSIRPMWSVIDMLDDVKLMIYEAGEKDVLEAYLLLGHDDFMRGFEGIMSWSMVRVKEKLGL
jgi:hypothetical protein